jgi:hypothetical protein
LRQILIGGRNGVNVIYKVFTGELHRSAFSRLRFCGWADEEVTEKLGLGISGAKTRTQIKHFIAALKRLRHPKSEFFRNL